MMRYQLMFEVATWVGCLITLVLAIVYLDDRGAKQVDRFFSRARDKEIPAWLEITIYMCVGIGYALELLFLKLLSPFSERARRKLREEWNSEGYAHDD